MAPLTESDVEQAALAWLAALGYAVLNGLDIAVGEPGVERRGPNYRDVLLERRLRRALVRLNPDFPPDVLEDAFRKLTRYAIERFLYRLSLVPARDEYWLPVDRRSSMHSSSPIANSRQIRGRSS